MIISWKGKFQNNPGTNDIVKAALARIPCQWDIPEFKTDSDYEECRNLKKRTGNDKQRLAKVIPSEFPQ